MVTSPPYPMIQMWDSAFTSMNPDIGNALNGGNGNEAFEKMHLELDTVWGNLYARVREGGFICINIGDATRRLGDSFRLYPNHARITGTFLALGADPLPVILWNKPTNAPNKFMGSGMLPAGAYVTLEHEYILLFRKGKKRVFKEAEEKMRRRQSAFFWEERNNWFSDRWTLSGVRQKLDRRDARDRSGAFPFELAYRLILMYSLRGDKVVDPFGGTGTTMFAAMVTGRNSIHIEVNPGMAGIIREGTREIISVSRELVKKRLIDHQHFIEDYTARKKSPLYEHPVYGFPVVTSQETDLQLQTVSKIAEVEEFLFRVEYENVSRETSNRFTQETDILRFD